MYNPYYSSDKTATSKYQRYDSSVSTLVIWTPRSGNIPVITGIMITNNNAAGTFTLFQGTTNSGPKVIYEFTVAASSMIAPVMGPVEADAADYIIYGRPSVSATDGWKVLLTGFEQ